MKKPAKPVLLLVICLLCFSVQKLQAQKLFFLFGHALYNSPVQKNLKDGYNYGLGGEAGFGIGADKTFFTGTIGYTKFNSVSGNAAGNLTYVPVKLGIRQYVFAKLLFVNANAGIANINPKNGDAQSRFTADAGVGVKLAGLDLGINYDGYAASNPSGWASWISFKAGFRIGL